MANSRSRKRNGLTKGGIFIVTSSKKSRHKNRYCNFPLTQYVTFSNEATQEDRDKYWKSYMRQEVELCKHQKYSRQNKGVQIKYKIHRLIKNLKDYK